MRNLKPLGVLALVALILGLSGCVAAVVSKMESASAAYTEAKVEAGRGDYSFADERIGEVEAMFRAPLFAKHIDEQKYRDLNAGVLKELGSLRAALQEEDRRLAKKLFQTTFNACEACHQAY